MADCRTPLATYASAVARAQRCHRPVSVDGHSMFGQRPDFAIRRSFGTTPAVRQCLVWAGSECAPANQAGAS